MQAESRPGNSVRDRFWLWSHVASTYNGQYGIPGESHITPVEAAHYMSIPNVFMIDYKGEPKPQDLNRFVLPFLSLEQVVWSIVDPGSGTPSVEQKAVLDLAFKTPVITGVVMDDFFTHRKGSKEGQIAALSLEELKKLKQRLRRGNKHLELWVVLYAFQVASDSFPQMAPYLELCDVIQIWPWYYGQEISKMPEIFDRVDRLVPGKRKALGSFMWNFGKSEPLPISMMEQQCELGLKWLHSSKIEAFIFGISWLCDRPLETVNWTRNWIHTVGSQKL